jgi:hypothetical protein
LNANIDALETFESMLGLIDFSGGAPAPGAHAPERLKIQNVEISVRPNIILRGSGKSRKKLLGAIKVHFPRTFPLNEDSAGYVSAIVQEYCRTCLIGDDEEIYAPYCLVIDMGSKAVYPGAKSTVARLRDVAAECRNIAALWGSITSDE